MRDTEYRMAQEPSEIVLGALSREPLTPSERDCGIALRIAGCVRSAGSRLDEKPLGFAWSIFVVRRPGVSEAAPRLGALARLGGRALGPVNEARVCAHGSVALGGEAWLYDEYELVIPRQLLAFSLRAASASRSVSRDQRNAWVDQHFALIRNAYADEDGYASWLDAHRRELACSVRAPEEGPLISLIVPLFKTPPVYLEALLDSVVAQTYDRWELVAVNASPDDTAVAEVLARYGDERIRVVELAENAGIAANTNVGIAKAQGDYVAFLDHDDFLEPQALAAIANAVNADPTIDLLYCDEDTFDGAAYRIPLFKPPYNSSFLESNNYIIHLLTVRKEALDATTRSSAEVDGAQDYDLTFKVTELGNRIVHLPWVLYHWRMHAGSTNANAQAKPWAQEAGRRAIADHLEREGFKATVERAQTDSTYRVDYQAEGSAVRYVRIDVGDGDGEALFAALSNALASGAELALVCHPDCVVSAADGALMASCFVRPDVFSVSPQVMRSDGLVESSGCIVAPDGSIIKLGKGLLPVDEGYLGRSVRPHDHLVTTDDVCMVRLSMAHQWFDQAQVYESTRYALNALCVCAYRAGMRNIYWPFAGARLTGPRPLVAHWANNALHDQARFSRVLGSLIAHGDPTHNPNFEPESPYYRLRPYADA